MVRKSALVAMSLGLSLACRRTAPKEDGSPPPPPSAATSPLAAARGVRLERATDGDATTVIRESRDRATAQSRKLVVYVGAPWCEPCRYFHAAAARGELDAEMPDLTLLEFDLDVDKDRLSAAGYGGEYVPLFALPDASGRASDRRFEGSIKGPGAVANIAPRLRALLAK